MLSVSLSNYDDHNWAGYRPPGPHHRNQEKLPSKKYVYWPDIDFKLFNHTYFIISSDVALYSLRAE